MDLFDKFNDRFFDSELPTIPVLFFDSTNPETLMMIGMPFEIDGIFWETENGYVIGVSSELSREGKYLTLLHEMIHLEQAVTERKRNHGKFFKRRCREILEEIS